MLWILLIHVLYLKTRKFKITKKQLQVAADSNQRAVNVYLRKLHNRLEPSSRAVIQESQTTTSKLPDSNR